MSKPGSVLDVDLEDRDPNNMNDHLQIGWSELVGEPSRAPRSPECAWRLSARCFRGSRACCYSLLAVLCAPPLAALLGCCFSLTVFQHIWCWSPCLRAQRLACAALRESVRACAQAVLAPPAEALARLCGGARLTYHRLPDGPYHERDALQV